MTETETETLMGPGEVCLALQVTRAQLKRWRDAGEFPEPRQELSIGAVWDAATVLAWDEGRARTSTQRQQAEIERRAQAIRAYRQTGNVSEAARQVGAARSSVIAWLEAAGEPLPRTEPRMEPRAE